MVNPQGEGSDQFGESDKGQPYEGQQQYPQYQNPQYQNPQYQNPQYPYAGAGYQAPTPTNTLAIVSLVLAILGLTFLPLLASICAVVCGHISRGQIKRTGEGGSGLATAGLVIGYVSIALFVIIVAGIILFAVAASTSSTY